MSIASTIYLPARAGTEPQLSEEERFEQAKEAALEWGDAMYAEIDRQHAHSLSLPESCPRHLDFCATCKERFCLDTCSSRQILDVSAVCNGCREAWRECAPFTIINEDEYICSQPRDPDLFGEPRLPTLPLRRTMREVPSLKEHDAQAFMSACSEDMTIFGDCDTDEEGMSIVYYVRKGDFFVRKQFEIYMRSSQELDDVPSFDFNMEPECQQKLDAFVAQFAGQAEERMQKQQEEWQKFLSHHRR